MNWTVNWTVNWTWGHSLMLTEPVARHQRLLINVDVDVDTADDQIEDIGDGCCLQQAVVCGGRPFQRPIIQDNATR